MDVIVLAQVVLKLKTDCEKVYKKIKLIWKGWAYVKSEIKGRRKCFEKWDFNVWLHLFRGIALIFLVAKVWTSLFKMTILVKLRNVLKISLEILI